MSMRRKEVSWIERKQETFRVNKKEKKRKWSLKDKNRGFAGNKCMQIK